MPAVMEALRLARSSDRSQTGAVSTNWLVVILIALMAAIGLWYAANADIEKFKGRATEAQTALTEMTVERDASLDAHKALAHAVGFRDESIDTSFSDLAAIETAMEAAKAEAGPALGGADARPTLQRAVAALIAANQAKAQALAAAKADLAKEVAARQSAETRTDDIEKTFNDQLAALNQQLKDEQQRADNQAQTDSARFDELTTSQQASDAAARSAQQALSEFQVQSGREVATKEAQIQALALRREPAAPDAPDGSVLSVGKQGSTAFIDVGGRDGLKRGTRFEVLRPGKAGELIPRGSVEVRDVKSDMALVGVVGKPDPFDPILPGDLVRNPHFEKGKVNHFFLLGDFPLTLSKDFATARLKELGAEVDDKLDTGTDILVVGEKNLSDEFATELTEAPEYKLAERLGMRIIRVSELSDFLRY
jgi:hypothetical protein